MRVVFFSSSQQTNSESRKPPSQLLAWQKMALNPLDLLSGGSKGVSDRQELSVFRSKKVMWGDIERHWGPLDSSGDKQPAFDFEPDLKALKYALRLDVSRKGTTFTFPELLKLLTPEGQKSIELEPGQENDFLSFLQNKAFKDFFLFFSYEEGAESFKVYKIEN